MVGRCHASSQAPDTSFTRSRLLEAVRDCWPDGCGLLEHDASEGDEVEAFDGLGKALVVPHEASEARCPCEGALHDPSSWQEHEAALGLGGA